MTADLVVEQTQIPVAHTHTTLIRLHRATGVATSRATPCVAPSKVLRANVRQASQSGEGERDRARQLVVGHVQTGQAGGARPDQRDGTDQLVVGQRQLPARHKAKGQCCQAHMICECMQVHAKRAKGDHERACANIKRMSLSEGECAREHRRELDDVLQRGKCTDFIW